MQAPAEELLYSESYWEEVQARMTAHPQVISAPTQSRKPPRFSHSARLLAAAASLPPSTCLRCMHIAYLAQNDSASLLSFPHHACFKHASCCVLSMRAVLELCLAIHPVLTGCQVV